MVFKVNNEIQENNYSLAQREINLIVKKFNKKFKINFRELFENEITNQRKIQLIKNFYETLLIKFKDLENSEAFNNFLKEFESILVDESKLIDKFLIICEKFGIQFKLPKKIDDIFHIYRIISNPNTSTKYYFILKCFYENSNRYLTKKHVEILLSEILGDSIIDLDVYFRNLKSVKLIKKQSKRYHLTEIGVTFFDSILKLKEEMKIPLIDKLDRVMLLQALYDEKGIPIQSHHHIQQISSLIKEFIDEIIEHDNVLEWSSYLDKLDDIILDLETFAQRYKNDFGIYQQILREKSELARKLAIYHEVAQESLNKYISLIHQGYDPKRMKLIINLFNKTIFSELSNCLYNNILNARLPQNEDLWMDILIINKKDFEDIKDNRIKESIMTEKLKDSKAIELLDFYYPSYKLMGEKLISKINKSPIKLSELTKRWDCNWKILADFINNLPSIITEFPIIAIAQKKIFNFKEGIAREGIFYTLLSGEKNDI